MNYNLSKVTENVKLGFMAASMSSRETCPDTCPMKKDGCYASYGPINWVWGKLTRGAIGKSFDDLIEGLKKLPKSFPFRMNQAGDLPGVNCRIDSGKLSRLVSATSHLKAWTYTHKPVFTSKLASAKVVKANRIAIKSANDNGFTVNISTNKLSEVDSAIALGIGPVVTILPLGSPNTVFTAKGAKVVKCPAQYKDGVTCATCLLCEKSNRSVAVGFEAHGAKKKLVSSESIK